MIGKKKRISQKVDYGFKTKYGHFFITFSNGYTVSMFNAFGSHTENHNVIEKSEWENRHDACKSATVELAVLYDNEYVTNMFTKTSDGEICGYVRPEEVAELLQKVSKEPPIEF